jgi:hypothetical protein
MRKGLLFCCLLVSFCAHAQQWLWGKRGGSETKFGNQQWETVWDITSDNAGNTYALCRADGLGRDIDGHDLPVHGDYDIIITSFDCAGNYRWSKVIGSNDHQDQGVSIKTDAEGSVYVCGELYMFNDFYTAHIDTDSTITNSRKSLFVVKYSGSGVFQWLQMPQPDTVSIESFSRNRYFDMEVEPSGNVHVLAMLSGGNYHGDYIVNELSMHLMHYNSAGNFLGATPFEMDMKQPPGIRPKMAFDTNSERYILAGTKPSPADSLTIAGDTLTGNAYIAAFNSLGQHIWTVLSSDENGGNGSGASAFDGRPAIDALGNIYVAGRTFNNDEFQGITMTNTVTVLPNNIPLVVKLDINGAVQWARNASAFEGRGISVALKGNDELYFTGYYDGKLRWAGFNGMQPSHVLNQEEDIFIATLNRNTGDMLMLDTLGSEFGTHDFVTCITKDIYGNAVLGGRFETEMYVGHADTLSMEGKTSDLFIAKYGSGVCWPASVQRIVNSEQITVWPNPASAEVTIKSNEKISSVAIVDVTGRTVVRRAANGERVTVDVSGLVSGIYFIKIININNIALSKKIVIE